MSLVLAIVMSGGNFEFGKTSNLTPAFYGTAGVTNEQVFATFNRFQSHGNVSISKLIGFLSNLQLF